MCEELFGGELDVTEEHQGVKSYIRRHRYWLHQHHAQDLGVLQKVLGVLQEMESFCRTKKNMFLPIRNGIDDALHELEVLKRSLARPDNFLAYFQGHMRDMMASRIKKMRSPKAKVVVDKGSQTPLQPAPRITPEPRKRRERTSRRRKQRRLPKYRRDVDVQRPKSGTNKSCRRNELRYIIARSQEARQSR